MLSLWFNGGQRRLVRFAPGLRWTAFDGVEVDRPVWLTRDVDFARLYGPVVHEVSFEPRRTFPDRDLFEWVTEGRTRYYVPTPFGEAVMGAMVRGELPLVDSDEDEDEKWEKAERVLKLLNRLDYDVVETSAVMVWAAREGYDSLWVRGDGPTNLMVLDPTLVRVERRVS